MVRGWRVLGAMQRREFSLAAKNSGFYLRLVRAVGAMRGANRSSFLEIDGAMVAASVCGSTVVRARRNESSFWDSEI